MQISKTHNKIYLQLFSLIIIFLISGSLLVNIFLGVTAIYFFYLMRNNSIKFNKDYFWPLIIIYAYLIFNSILSVNFSSLSNTSPFKKSTLLGFADLCRSNE